MRLFPLLSLLAVLDLNASAQTLPVPDDNGKPSSSTPRLFSSNASRGAAAVAPSVQVALDRLTQTNHDLLDLLKKQQSVLEDIQYDRRLQSRQIQSLGERLGETLQENAKLQAKIATLEATAAAGPAVSNNSQASTSPAQPSVEQRPAQANVDPTPPSTYLPPPEQEGAPGTKSWHRLFTLSGTDGKDSDIFHIEGPQWRVIWHNLDKPGKAYVNTSALFINAFPKDDTIPQKVCAKLGTGGSTTEITGAGNFYLKVEASGGTWELAVEDFH